MTTSTIQSGETQYSSGEVASPTHAISRFSTYWALYTLTLRQHLHGKRWMVVMLLCLVPAGLAVLIRFTGSPAPNLFLEFVLIWMLIPQALLPLVALLYASGIVEDEQEEQTITYLLIRPISKWALYAIKMAATWTTTVLLVTALVLISYLAIYAAAGTDGTTVAIRCLKTIAILSLAAIAYCSIFGAISLLTKRTLIIGILYIVIVEGLLASFPLSLRWGTVIYHTRVMAYRTMNFLITWPRGGEDDVAAAAWMLNVESDPTLAEHPQLSTCVLILLGVSVISTALAGWYCSQREFHVKTPEKA